jgi:hypothetical protein
MAAPETNNPAVGSGRASKVSKDHLAVVTQNGNPRQRWRARVQMRRIAVSSELRSFLRAIAAKDGTR